MRSPRSLIPKVQSRDIWAAPPGGRPPAGRRSHLKSVIAFVLIVAMAIGGSLMYAWMKTSTAVSAEDALEEFTASKGAGDQPVGRRRADPEPIERKRHPRKAADRGTGSSRSNSARAVADAASGGGVSRRADTGASAAPAAPASNKEPEPDRGKEVAPPEEGVYAWTIEGHEQVPGMRRELPERSHRVITHQGGNAWTEHHIFSEEREQWINMSVSPDGVTGRSARNRVKMGPVEEDNTVVFRPVIFVSRYPSKVGQTWRGSWSGRTSGSYAARTFEKTTIVIQGEEIEVYASEVVMDLRGELEGRVVTRSWYSLEHGIVVKQYQKLAVTSGPAQYQSEWTGQVLSLQPQK